MFDELSILQDLKWGQKIPFQKQKQEMLNQKDNFVGLNFLFILNITNHFSPIP